MLSRINERRLLSLTVLLFCMTTHLVLGKAQFKQQIIDKTQKAVVTIEVKASLEAYEAGGLGWKGTGFVVNKTKGLILTNAHVVGRGTVGTYLLAFYDGVRTDAKLLYYDPWLDYAFLQVPPEDIPGDTTEIKFSAQNPRMGQAVFMIGNNENKSFSIHTGNISNTHTVAGLMPQHSINISLNAKGGSSGSPVLNEKGEAIALNYGISETFAIGLHPWYVRYALRFIEQGRVPVRQHIGAIVNHYALDQGVRYRSFPKEKAKSYLKQFPDSQGQALIVDRVLRGSPADGILLPGDIIWAINGEKLGPNLVDLDMAMNACKHSSVRVTICRNGIWSELELPLYSLEEYKVQKMVSFGGALLFEIDDICSDVSGEPAGTLTFVNAQSSTTFKNVIHYAREGGAMRFMMKIQALDETPITGLNQLIESIPKLIEKKHFTIDYVNYIPYDFVGFDKGNIWAHHSLKADVEYDENSPEPKLYTFDREKMEWIREPILKGKPHS